MLIILGHILSHFAGETNLGKSFARIKFGPGMKSPLVILPHEKLLYTVPEDNDNGFHTLTVQLYFQKFQEFNKIRAALATIFIRKTLRLGVEKPI